MQVAIPGIAYGALKDSELAAQYPELWTRMNDYSISLTQGKGISVHIDLSEDDWSSIRACMLVLVRRLASLPYPVRGLEGNIIMQQLMIAMGRVDDNLFTCDKLNERVR